MGGPRQRPISEKRPHPRLPKQRRNGDGSVWRVGRFQVYFRSEADMNRPTKPAGSLSRLEQRHSKRASMRLTFVAPASLDLPSPFSHAPLEVFGIVVHLLKCKSECEEAFRLAAGKSLRETLTTERSDLCGIGVKSGFNGLERGRPPTRL